MRVLYAHTPITVIKKKREKREGVVGWAWGIGLGIRTSLSLSLSLGGLPEMSTLSMNCVCIVYDSSFH